MEQDGERMAEMEVAVSGKNVIVYHTEVVPALQGKGASSKLLAALVDYARQHEYKIIALCPYVHAQFTKHPDQYGDVWNRNWKEK
jgi:hypothetical protein